MCYLLAGSANRPVLALRSWIERPLSCGRLGLAALLLLLAPWSAEASASELQIPAPAFFMPLAKDLSAAPSGVPVVASGAHQFLTVAGRTGYRPSSVATSLKIETSLHAQPRGSVVLWVSPLESLAVAAPMSHFLAQDPNAQEYGLLSDTFPINDIQHSIFSWYWRSFWHPQMVAKFKTGPAGGAAADYAVTPYVPVEHLPLREGKWYQFVLTWDKPASRLCVYINGILAGTTHYPFVCEAPKPQLFLGNTAMACAELAMYEVELSAAQIAAGYAGARFPVDPEVNGELARLFTVRENPPVDWQPGPDWRLEFDRSLTREGDFDGWVQQGCLKPGMEMKERTITPEGLLLETPDQVAVETRVYFWSPRTFEGDLAVEYDFRPERNDGLALLVVQASGMQREDFITDHPPRTTGSMATIIADRVRNYHWEYFRHSVDVRCDLGTQAMVKNPWYRPLQLAAIEPMVVGRWYRLLFVQEGPRLRAAIDGRWVMDVRDDPYTNNGPVFNTGRIGLRLMYATRMRFRNLRVWNRSRFEPESR